jgi:polar amino acid transport system substrate-binding protein
MGKRPGLGLLAAALVLVIAGSTALGACSLGSASGGGATAATSKIEQILGHAPTGLAKQIADQGLIVVADDANFPPQSYIDDKGDLVGFDVDVAEKVAQVLDLKVKFVNPTWDAVPAGLQAGRYDVSIGSMTITSAAQQTLDFTSPYYYTEAQMVVKRGSPPIASLQQAKGQTIGVAAQSTYYFYLVAVGGINVKMYSSDAAALSDLKNGRLNGVLTANVIADQAIAAGEPFALSGPPLFYEPRAFAVRKGESDLLTLLNYAIKTMQQDGSLESFAKKWYGAVNLTQPPPSSVPSYEQALAAHGQ